MATGKDRIVFPLDVADADSAARFVDLLSGSVGMFKVGLELFIRSGPAIVGLIRDHGAARVFLDLKLHDIPATVERAMAAVADLGVDLVTVHCGENPQMLSAAVRGGGHRVGVLGVTVLTSVSGDDLRRSGFTDELAQDVTGLVLKKARDARDAGCAGVVCSGKEAALIKQQLGADFMAVTPGIRPSWEAVAADDQKRAVTPADAVAAGADYLVVGRPIRDARDPVAAARRLAEEIDRAVGGRP